MLRMRNRYVLLLLMSMLVATLLFLGQSTISPTRQAHANSSQRVTVYLQTMDSCKQAVAGAFFRLQGNGVVSDSAAGYGAGVATVSATSPCVLERGNCLTVPTGCVSWQVPIPASGMETYSITETAPASSYAICLGGSDCPGGPDIIIVGVDADGHVTATVTNIYPDGSTITFPTLGAPYTGTQTDPIVVHNSLRGNGNCDGDGDADDHVTGSEGFHPQCDSDKDR